MLEGQIETSYTKADNKCVVTTDSMKNTVNGEHWSDRGPWIGNLTSCSFSMS